jgi:hypothetical protein
MASKFQVFSLNETNPEVKEIRKRKAHRKSRLGCLACKARKVKVSERLPVAKINDKMTEPGCFRATPDSRDQSVVPYLLI